MNKERTDLAKTAVPSFYHSDSAKENVADNSVINIVPQKKKGNVAAINSTTLKNTENLRVIDAYTNIENLQVMDAYTNTENLQVMDASDSEKENVTDDSVINIVPQNKKGNVAATDSTTLKNTENLQVMDVYTNIENLQVMDAYTNTENLQVMNAYTNTENLQIMDTYTNTENLHVMDAYTESSTVMTNNASQIKKQAVAEKWLSILENIKNVHLPNKWTCMTFPNSVVIGIWKPNGKPAKRLVVKSDLTIQIPKLEFRYSLSVLKLYSLHHVHSRFSVLLVNIGIQTFIENKEINLPGMTVLNSVEDIMKYISVLQSVLLCQGRDNGQWFSKQCLGFVDPKDSGKLYFGKFRCAHCRINCLNEVIRKLRIKCTATQEEVLKERISTLPPGQQEAIKTCFKAATCSKYVPHVDTLHKYLRQTQSAYGFNESIFKCLRKTSEQLNSDERRGSLLIDEMKLSEALKFNRYKCQFEGFVDLGDYTPEHQQNETGDHALVIMYQPFRGRWVQALACFLSKGCAPSNVLTCLILELTTDGAQWNRSMWTKFGITEENISCQHPCDPDRRLWFCSDFPHLIKNFRNCIVACNEIWTPDGIVKKKHWLALLDLEHIDLFNMKISYRFSANHLQPKYYQKMNVPMAFEHIKHFIEFLNQWESTAKRMGHKYLTNNTSLGMNITLRATLEIMDFLSFQCNYQYLMTSRLNQDALEGSNVTGGEMLSALLNVDIDKERSGQKEFLCILDSIIENASVDHLDPSKVAISDTREVKEVDLTQYTG
ncbi:PREDICTED: uncharacterized protein LOC105570765, partial [Vollenhovia emeryi]|uniref:uncharacterized protein LOC105570765 n=1 Tax=Vollenhovia emeryi TaxID=411798 RepID=UPI0005F3DBEE